MVEEEHMACVGREVVVDLRSKKKKKKKKRGCLNKKETREGNQKEVEKGLQGLGWCAGGKLHGLRHTGFTYGCFFFRELKEREIV
jgi:hypothetical protein